MLNNINELIIFFLIIIFIILSYYDLKYSIILIIILILLYIYSNKITNKHIKPEYKIYNNNIDDIFNKLEKYEKNDPQSYKLALKYYKNFIKNINLLYKIDTEIEFKSLLENAEIYLNKSIEKFNAIIFSINTYDNEYEKEYINLIKNLKIESNKIINKTERIIINNNKKNKKTYNMFDDNDPQIKLFNSDNIKSHVYDKIYDNNNIFYEILDEPVCNDYKLLISDEHHLYK